MSRFQFLCFVCFYIHIVMNCNDTIKQTISYQHVKCVKYMLNRIGYCIVIQLLIYI
ncbi:hypothetical protein BDF19DRAFT_440764 [Syncephalis fuscata]|nr:hypothetical protein BDF19DRAFT_440764 [Syncephalis fuscata]